MVRINDIYGTIEASVAKLTGKRPYGTDRLSADLDCDSLDTLEIIMDVEREHNVIIPGKTVKAVSQEATMLDLALLLTARINNQ